MSIDLSRGKKLRDERRRRRVEGEPPFFFFSPPPGGFLFNFAEQYLGG